MEFLLQKNRKWLLPIGVIAVAYVVATVIRDAGPEAEVVKPEPQVTVVRVVEARGGPIRLSVRSQGEVGAEYSIELISELPGKVKKVSPAFLTGGYFSAGDVLLEINPIDYQLAQVRAGASVAEAEEELAIERSEAELAKQGLFPLKEAKVASAEARLQSARAELAQADLELERTRVRAPFDGRVLFTKADLGQYVSKGEALARIFSTGRAEIRLPLTDDQLRYLDSPFGSGREGGSLGTPVTLRGTAAGQQVEWIGYLDRMDGAVDNDNRVWYAVAYMDDPYGLKSAATTIAPLVLGLFVEAEIEGRQVADVYQLPRSALRNDTHVLVVDSENRLRKRSVEVLRTDFSYVYVAKGIENGDRVCISPIETFVDGLLVEAVDSEYSTDMSMSAGA